MVEKIKELKTLLLMTVIFLALYLIPFTSPRFLNGLHEAFFFAQDYSRLHVLLVLIPALFIMGAVQSIINQESVVRFLGSRARQWLAYLVAAVSGTILAVSSLTILPLFSGIYKKGAGLGPAIAFLYSGPAINAVAIIMTTRVLGWQLGIARTAGAITFSILIGLIMHILFRKEMYAKQEAAAKEEQKEIGRPIWQTMIFFLLLSGILLVLNWAKPDFVHTSIFTEWIQMHKWLMAGGLALLFGLVLVVFYGFKLWKVLITAIVVWLTGYLYPAQPLIPYVMAVYMLCLWLLLEKGELRAWLSSTWGFAKLIIPLLFISVLVSGAVFGRPGHESWIPSEWIQTAAGGNSLRANFVASVSGAFMYFATLTEVPILNGLLNNGWGKGPALALLLAGPAFSLPGMLVIDSVLGFKKTLAYVCLVIIFSTLAGYLFGHYF